jgi:hypothetical protein
MQWEVTPYNAFWALVTPLPKGLWDYAEGKWGKWWCYSIHFQLTYPHS